MKLIDWATAPVGAAVVNQTNKLDVHIAELIGFVTTKTVATKRLSYSQGMHIFTCSLVPALTKRLRLAPADQQPWLIYEQGVTVVPEWAEVMYKGITIASVLKTLMVSEYDTDFKHKNSRCIHTYAYKLGNAEGKLFKDGWTDNPDEVGE